MVSVLGSASSHEQPLASVTVPFSLVEVGGNPRPIIPARFNGHPMRMMIHSNASLFAQLKHGQAAAFGVRLLGAHQRYGIDQAGHVSHLGRDQGKAATLTVGTAVVRNAPVSVFEVPQDEYGMLGIQWISQTRLVLDYAHKQALLAPTAAQLAATAQALRRAGYVAIPMVYNKQKQRYMVGVTINGVSRRMAVASASEFTLDSEFARLAGVPKSAQRAGEGSGPTGTHVPLYHLAGPVRVQLNDWTSPPIAIGDVEDTYGYSALKRPANPMAADGGDLGGSFLVQTRAVIDFGSRLLYLARN